MPRACEGWVGEEKARLFYVSLLVCHILYHPCFWMGFIVWHIAFRLISLIPTSFFDGLRSVFYIYSDCQRLFAVVVKQKGKKSILPRRRLPTAKMLRYVWHSLWQAFLDIEGKKEEGNIIQCEKWAFLSDTTQTLSPRLVLWKAI